MSIYVWSNQMAFSARQHKEEKKMFSIISQGPIIVPLEFEIWVGNTVYTNLNLGVFDISNY